MIDSADFRERRHLEHLSRETLEAYQLDKLNRLLGEIIPHNRFYADKLANVRLPLTGLHELATLPITTKRELQGDGTFATNRTYELARYVRFHRTSGTHGRPMLVTDTASDWKWWLDTWQFVLDAAGLTPNDRVFMAFSFGPFIGFWSAHEAITARGAMAVPGGGLSSSARLELLRDCDATALCCTPTYALRLAEVAEEQGISIAALPIAKIIVAGEPGGSVPSIRHRIETAWQAEVIDHTGATEVGPWGYADPSGQGIHVVESEFIAEFVSLDTGDPATSGELAELYLTTLGRQGAPVIRYRTGDLVRPEWPTQGNRFVHLVGGVLGRADDMLVIRGVNIFPSAIEEILRSFPEIQEYRITAHKQGEMDALSIEVEDAHHAPQRIGEALERRLGLHVAVSVVAPRSLPRFEAKGQRFVDKRRIGP